MRRLVDGQASQRATPSPDPADGPSGRRSGGTPQRITPANPAAPYNGCIDTYMEMVVLRCRAQNLRVPRKIALIQRRHDAAAAGTGAAHAHLLVDGDRLARTR